MAERYSNQLSYGANNLVIALSETEVAKVFRGDTRSDIGRNDGPFKSRKA